MDTVSIPDRRATIHATNIGGIGDATVELRPGVNVLAGRNATNRTSFLQAIMAGLGSKRPTLKADADRGTVELSIGDETYTRSIDRDGQSLSFDGQPYTDEPEPADLFAFLLESNEARQAVERGEDLRDIAMQPVDTEAIRDEIERLRSRKYEIESELEQRDDYRGKLEQLENEITRIESQLEERRAELSKKEGEIKAADADLEESKESQAELESKLDELQEKRSTLEDIRYRLDTERETLSELEEEREEVESKLTDLTDIGDEDMESIESRLSELHEQKQTINSKINQLQALIQFNEEVLDGEEIVQLDSLASDQSTTAEELTGRLLTNATSFHCWTCGSETSVDEVEDMLDRLRDRRRALVDDRNAITDEIESVTERKRTIDDRRERRSKLTDRRDRIKNEISDAKQETESLKDRKETLEEEIDHLEEAVEDLRVDEYDEIIDLNIDANAIELEIERLESQLEQTNDRIESVRDRLDQLEERESELEEVETELESARTRIERIEKTVVEAFNDHMETLIQRLDYGNIERVWLERVERTVREGRRTVEQGFFELHVVRSTDEGTVYEDTLDHLSESERAVIGLVFALAGYLAHTVYEEVPFILLDSIEAIDADRIATLVDYLGQYAGYLVVALLPEDAAALDDEYHYITEID